MLQSQICFFPGSLGTPETETPAGCLLKGTQTWCHALILPRARTAFPACTGKRLKRPRRPNLHSSVQQRTEALGRARPAPCRPYQPKTAQLTTEYRRSVNALRRFGGASLSCERSQPLPGKQTPGASLSISDEGAGHDHVPSLSQLAACRSAGWPGIPKLLLASCS